MRRCRCQGRLDLAGNAGRRNAGVGQPKGAKLVGSGCHGVRSRGSDGNVFVFHGDRSKVRAENAFAVEHLAGGQACVQGLEMGSDFVVAKVHGENVIGDESKNSSGFTDQNVYREVGKPKHKWAGGKVTEERPVGGRIEELEIGFRHDSETGFGRLYAEMLFCG